METQLKTKDIKKYNAIYYIERKMEAPSYKYKCDKRQRRKKLLKEKKDRLEARFKSIKIEKDIYIDFSSLF